MSLRSVFRWIINLVKLLNKIIGVDDTHWPLLGFFMKESFFYYLVDTQARRNVDLRNVKRQIIHSIVYAFPEATAIDVRREFYTFALPSSAKRGLTGRLQKLGRLIARQLPGLCSIAMKCYQSDVHADSKQLFKRVKAERAVKKYKEELARGY